MLNNFFASNLTSISLLLAIGAALAFVIGSIFMGLSEGLSKFFPTLMVYATYCVGASLQTIATRHSGIGLTYILVLGLEAILSVLVSILLFKEGYSALKVVGMFLVTIGIVFLRSSNS